MTKYDVKMYTHAHTHPFNGTFSGTTRVSRYQKGKTNLNFTEARDTEWQWHQLGHMQVCTSLQTDNHTSTPPLSFLQTGYTSCRPTNSVKALMATNNDKIRCENVIAHITKKPVSIKHSRLDPQNFNGKLSTKLQLKTNIKAKNKKKTTGIKYSL